MAVVKVPALSIDASGNVGGICFSKWRGLSIARDAWTGTVPNTSAQVIIQGYMTTVSQAWSGTLTENERESWRAAAREQVRLSRVKTPYIPTGYQYFMELNMQVIRQAFPVETLPPIAIIPYGFESIALTWNVGKFWVEVKFEEHLATIPTTHQGEIWRAGPFDNAGRRPIDPEYKFLTYAPLLTGYTDSAVIQFKYYWYRCRWVENKGRVGNWFELQVYTG